MAAQGAEKPVKGKFIEGSGIWFETWGEFKAAVEAQGLTDGDAIQYIDCSSCVLVVRDRCRPEENLWILE